MFLEKKKSGEVTLIIDIGSSSVGGALVSNTKGSSPKILFSTRLSVVLQNESERGRSLAAISVALESVLKTISAEHIVFHKSHIIFSSPWYISETSVLKIDHDQPTFVTRHAIEQLTKESEKKFIEEASSSHPNGEIVERRVIRSRLNGYDTTKPYNKKAKNVEITFFASIVQKDVIEAVHRILDKHFHLRNNQISSFSLAAFSAISSLKPEYNDFLIVDVRGEVTDLSLVAGGALMKSLSFAQGKNALTKSVAENSGCCFPNW